MLIYRDEESEKFKLQFEDSEESHFKESVVATQALSINPYDQSRLQMTDEEALTWSFLAVRIMPSASKKEGLMQVDREELNILGTATLYFSQTTEEELYRIAQNNPPAKQIFASRRVEGSMARSMYEVISKLDGFEPVTTWRLLPISNFVPWRNS